MAINPILGPHLSSRCSDATVLDGEKFAFDYTELQVSLVFSSGSIAFLPLSVWVGIQADIRGRDFAWLRRIMALGLVFNAVAFTLMGPAPFFSDHMMRALETPCAMVLSQMILGVANALTLIAAFPYFEGACERSAKGSLTTAQRIAVAGTWQVAHISFFLSSLYTHTHTHHL